MPLGAKQKTIIAGNDRLIQQFQEIGRLARQQGSGFGLIGSERSNRVGEQVIIRILGEIQEELRLRRGILEPQTVDTLGLTSGG